MVTKEIIENVIDDLRGTCSSLDKVLDYYGSSFEELSLENCDQIDSEIFNCECCGWWCDISELSSKIDDALVCTDCEDQWLETEEE